MKMFKGMKKLIALSAIVPVLTLASVSSVAADQQAPAELKTTQVDVAKTLGMGNLKPMDTKQMKNADGEFIVVALAGAAVAVSSYSAALDIARNNADYHTRHGHPTSTHIHWWGYIHNHYSGH